MECVAVADSTDVFDGLQGNALDWQARGWVNARVMMCGVMDGPLRGVRNSGVSVRVGARPQARIHWQVTTGQDTLLSKAGQCHHCTRW